MPLSTGLRTLKPPRRRGHTLRLSTSHGLPMRPTFQLLQPSATQPRPSFVLRFVGFTDALQVLMRFVLMCAHVVRPVLLLPQGQVGPTQKQATCCDTYQPGHFLKIRITWNSRRSQCGGQKSGGHESADRWFHGVEDRLNIVVAFQLFDEAFQLLGLCRIQGLCGGWHAF